MKSNRHRPLVLACGLLAVFLVVAHRYLPSAPVEAADRPRPHAPDDGPQSVVIDAEQARQVKVGAVATREFTAGVDAVGRIDFDGDHLAEVNSPYAGRVSEVFAKAGNLVRHGQALFTVASPDLAQAEATLVANAAQRAQADATLKRAQAMAQVQANAPRDLEQAVADQQAAEGNYQAARQALRIFGKSDPEMDRIVATRRVDGELRIDSPVDGRVVSRNVSVGDVVQPGDAPARFEIRGTDAAWFIADVPEDDAAAVHAGDTSIASVQALPHSRFTTTVDYVADRVDPDTHRVTVRSVLSSPPPDLRAGMLVTYRILTARPSRMPALPMNAVVRQGDGSMVAFSTLDGRRFTRETVRVGTPQDGYYPLLSGLKDGQRVATDGALFLSNALDLQSL
ncbi:efflux RND transporter periplasmic adaptor subunit [Luteibacter sp. PPL554]